ncbi:phosphoethanolamine transferase [Acinetobacter shaoyimingii]|uniref:Phosphoethanolamine transferase n=1 Tax=Acinetobacter shaoyimingii TaxID=2715164 RepID=A0A6G8RSP0_9GAMM|nr:phosphoethanolamine transferase [Acinetobacter shaoyimingii]QIO04808.1 phosphoethanolamine transferase [Acinetobacter shaoyimingii]
MLLFFKNNKVVEVICVVLLAILSSALLLNGINQYAPPIDIIIFALIILVLMGSEIAYRYFVFPILFLTLLYVPIGMSYGVPNFQNIVSLYATNFSEAKEFLFLIPLHNYLYALFLFISFFITKLIVTKKEIMFYKNKFFIIILFILFCSKTEIFEFYLDCYDSVHLVSKEIKELQKVSANDTWTVDSFTPKYKNHILIIGESARRDFFNAYGYPVQNTTFLSNSAGVLVDGLSSGDRYTIGSLRLMLTNPDVLNREADYSKTFIQLANKAGYKTYWFSNQGQFGKHDTPITAIANQSINKTFLKFNDYNSQNIQDTQLLTHLEKALDDKINEPKLVVLHTMGSHTNACDRLNYESQIYLAKDKRYEYLACYISSIHQTDDFIKSTYEILSDKFKKNGETFSIIYFSDHGLNQHFDGNKLKIDNAGESKRHYQIPLFKVSSDDEIRKVLKSEKSGLNFTRGIAHWLGIQSAQFEQYDLFDGISDKNDYGLKRIIEVNPAKDDPATVADFYLGTKEER